MKQRWSECIKNLNKTPFRFLSTFVPSYLYFRELQCFSQQSLASTATDSAPIPLCGPVSAAFS